MPLTTASWTVTFGCSWNRSRSGCPTADGLEQVGGDLVQERLERVVVVLVDHRDGDVGVLELPGGTDATEAPTEDDHVRRPGVAWCIRRLAGRCCHVAGSSRAFAEDGREFARGCRHPPWMRSVAAGVNRR